MSERNESEWDRPEAPEDGSSMYGGPGPEQNSPLMPVYEPPMKWHNFLIYFSLWTGGFLSIFNGVRQALGMSYEDAAAAEAIYNLYGGLRVADVVSGALLVALGVYMIVTRFALARRKAGAPAKLLWVYALNIIIGVLYIAAVAVILKVGLGNLISTTAWTSLVGSVAMMAINQVYYRKRAELFVN